MEFVFLAASWDMWMAVHAGELVAVITAVSTLTVAWRYGPGFVVYLRTTRLGEMIGLVDPDELRFRQTERVILDRLHQLKRILDRAKKESNRLPKPEEFGLEPGDVLPGRKDRYKHLIDQIKSAIHASLRLLDANQLAHLRRMVAQEIKEIKDLPAMGDSVAVDTLSAIEELEDLLDDLDQAAREQDRAEHEALEQAQAAREDREEEGPSPYRVGLAAETPSQPQAESPAPAPTRIAELRKRIQDADEAEQQPQKHNKEEDDGDQEPRRRIAEPA